MAWTWNPGFSSNRPTHYLLDYGDFTETTIESSILQERSLDCLCWTTKRQDKADSESVRIQSALCKVVCEENGRVLKIAVVKIYWTVVSIRRIANSFVIRIIKNKLLMNRQDVDSGTRIVDTIKNLIETK